MRPQRSISAAPQVVAETGRVNADEVIHRQAEGEREGARGT
jgi:hypothetical protein